MEINQPPVGISLVLGGARSGKSRFAESWIEAHGQGLYLATAQAFDEEMTKRITIHKDRRGEQWDLIEEPLDLAGALVAHGQPDRPILVDCLTLWITNLMIAESDIEAAFRDLESALPSLSGPVVFVSNEVGQGIVPENAMARAFRDHAGLLHQRIAAQATRVIFMTAGLAQVLKDEG